MTESTATLVRPAAPPPAGRAVTGRVLVVEHALSVRERITRFLGSAGYASRAVAKGADALRVVLEERPDVVLLDLQLLNPSGLDTFFTIRAVAPDLKVILTTEKVKVKTAQKALADGAFDYVTKPIEMSYLEDCVAAAVMIKRLEGTPG